MHFSSSEADLSIAPPGFHVVRALFRSSFKQITLTQDDETKKLYIISQFFGVKLTPSFEKTFEKMKKIKHPAICPVFKYTYSPEESIICIFSCINCINPLHVLIQQTSDQNLQPNEIHSKMQIVLGLINAIKFLHSKNFVCGDIYPELIFYDQKMCPFLTVFGHYNLFPNYENDTAKILKSITTAPELQLRYQPNEKSDIFAFAMISMRLFSKAILLWKKEASQLSLALRLSNGYRPVLDDRIPLFLQNIIEMAWDQDPTQRPTAKSIEIKIIKDAQQYFIDSKNQMFFQYQNSISQYLSNAILTDFTSFVNATPQLSQKGKQLANKYISFQEHILGVTFQNYNSTLQWIIDRIDPNKDKIHILNFFIVAAKCRYRVLNELSRLLIAISNKFEQMKDLPQQFVMECFQIMMKKEPLQSMTGPLYFIFYLYLHKAITEDLLVSQTKNLYLHSVNQNHACLPFCYFANIIYHNDRDLFDKIWKIFENNANNDFFNDQYKVFYQNFNDYKKDDFAFYMEYLPEGKSLYPLTNYLRYDAYQSFQSLAIGSPVPLRFKIPSNVFEPCSYATESTFFQLYALLYNSQKIFHQLMLNRTSALPGEKQFRKMGQYAVAGGSEALVKQVFNFRAEYIAGTPQVAAKFHRNDMFKTILKYHPDMTVPDKDGKLVTTAAAESNNVFMILQCLKIGISITNEAFKRTPLHAAAQNGSLEALEILLEVDQADVNARDIWGSTPLHYSVDNCKYLTTKLLLKTKNIDINAVNEKGKTPFHLAIQVQDVPIIKLFLTHKSLKTNLTTVKGQNALHLAAKTTAEIFEIVAKSSKINPNEKDNKGRTPLDLAKENNLNDIVNLCENYMQKYSTECRI